MGKAVGLSRTSINNIEKGRQKVLLDTFCKIARVIDERPEVLVALLPVPEVCRTRCTNCSGNCHRASGGLLRKA